MAATRPSSAIWSGSPNSARWWEAKEFASIPSSAQALAAAGDLGGLESLYQQAYEEARRLEVVPAQVSYLAAIGNTRLLRFEYAEALQAYLEGKRLAEASGDWAQAGLIALNLAGLYEAVWDYGSAVTAAEEGRQVLRRTGAGVEFRTQLLLQLGRMYTATGDARAQALLAEGIEAARGQGDAALEARGLDLLAELFSEEGRLEEAEAALIEAFRLRALHARADLGWSYGRLGAVRLARFLKGKADSRALDEAERFTARALEAGRRADLRGANYQLQHQRGRILAARGREAEALAAFRTAVLDAARWRATVPAAASSLTGSNIEVDRRIFDSFVEAAGRRAAATGSARLAAESFLASEINRAASLRETSALAAVWRQKLPGAYWETLSDLRAEEARLMDHGFASSPASVSLRLKLTEMEALAGLGVFIKPPENFISPSSLIHFRDGLRESELFLSFHLGRAESLLWAVTRTAIQVYRLEPQGELENAIRAFRRAVAESRPEAARLGESLYGRLFGQLSPDELGKESWLLSIEGSLFEVPYGALVTGRVQGKAVYLIEGHAVQIIPTAFWLRELTSQKDGSWLMVGDAVYNSADSRIASGGGGKGTEQQLNRLPGSGLEVESCARHAGPEGRLLKGTAATAENFVLAAETRPAVIHLATHVLTSQNPHGQAFLAFSLTSNQRPGLLAASDVAAMRVPGALVVMTGCAAGTGTAADGAGLQGLTRAWLTAGASNVVATLWPVEDRSGDLLPSFYRHRRDGPPAEALRRSQREAIASGTWQADAANWAAYQVSGGER